MARHYEKDDVQLNDQESSTPQRPTLSEVPRVSFVAQHQQHPSARDDASTSSLQWGETPLSSVSPLSALAKAASVAEGSWQLELFFRCAELSSRSSSSVQQRAMPIMSLGRFDNDTATPWLRVLQIFANNSGRMISLSIVFIQSLLTNWCTEVLGPLNPDQIFFAHTPLLC